MKIVKHISDFKHNWFKILHHKRLSPLAKILQFTLLSCNTKKYRPKVKDIATQFGESERNMYRAIKELKSAGYLVSYGLKDKCVWNVYDTPTFITAKCGSQDNSNDCQNKTATGGIPLLYNDCGAIKSQPPQSPNEEIILPPKPFGEMSEEDWNDYLPF